MQPLPFCDSDEDCFGDKWCCGENCGGNVACPSGTDCCVAPRTLTACPAHYHRCDANATHPSPFCDADADCAGDSHCCGELCAGNEACSLGYGCCVVALSDAPPPPPVHPSPPPPPPVAARTGGFVPFGARGGGMVFERYGRTAAQAEESSLTLRGNRRGYLALAPAELWGDIAYDRLRLLGKTLRVTIDVSRVGCGCNAALYLVSMPAADDEGSGYCDIQSAPARRCLEVDLFEGNVKAAGVALHTQAGEAADGTCNQWGCAVRLGAADGGCKYGRGAPNVDSARPFELEGQFDLEGRIEVWMVQDGVRRRVWSAEDSGNPAPAAVPDEARQSVEQALADGVVLVASLWAAKGDGMAWLDGGCNEAYPHCVREDAAVKFSNLAAQTVALHPSEPVPQGRNEDRLFVLVSIAAMLAFLGWFRSEDRKDADGMLTGVRRPGSPSPRKNIGKSKRALGAYDKVTTPKETAISMDVD
ncbi:hypothetical protein AB1Y20_022199 [Prymnesium parvum]|uniref:cellulose 1,4-beta-cellobiosidase (non-reducing end) n=1 Tax=Prymnesium parvum TaxID=97485 RepID=A0AB34JG70_PRYPA